MKRVDWAFGLVAIISLIVHLYAAYNPSTPIRDAEEYQWAAKNLVETGHWYAGDPVDVDMRLHSKRPPLYPLFLSLSNSIGSWGWRVLQIALVLLLYQAGLALLGMSRFRPSIRIYQWLFILGLPVFFTSTFQLADLMLAVLLSLMLLYGLLFWRYGRSRDVLVLSVLWSLALLCKPVMLPSVFLIPILVMLKKRRWQGYYALVLPFVVVVAISLYNRQQTGSLHYSSISTINRAFYNARMTIAHAYGADSAIAYTDHQAYAIPVTKEEFTHYRNTLNARSNQTMADHPGTYLRIHLMGMAKGLLDPGRFEVYSYFGSEEHSEGLSTHIWAGNWSPVIDYLKRAPAAAAVLILMLMLQLVKVGGLVISWKHWQREGLLYLASLLYFLFLAGPIGAFRFSLPAYIPFLLLATIGLSHFPLLFKKGAKG